MNIYQEILDLQQSNIPFVVVSVISKNGHGPQIPGAKMIVTAESKMIGTIGGGSLEFLALKESLKMFSSTNGYIVKKYAMTQDESIADTEQTEMICGGTIDLLYELHQKLASVYIFGAGHLGEAIAYHLAKLDYKIVICDCRHEYKKEIPGGFEVVIDDYSKILNNKHIPPDSFMIIVTHSHDLDFVILKRICRSNWNPKYIGVIASKKKSEIIFKRLMRELKEDEIKFNNIYCPIGLNIGGTTPHDIAISVVAEVQAIRFGKTGHNHYRDL